MKKFLLSVATLFAATTVSAQTALPYSNDLLSDNGDFKQTTEYASEADKDSVPNVWNFDAKYGAKASAFVKNVRYAVTSTLASPVFKLEGTTDVTLSFEHAGKFFANPSTDATLHIKAVSADGKESTTQVEIPAYFTNSSWTFVPNSISLSQFNGFKTLQVLFVYKSSTTDAGTWEIKNFSLKGTGETPVTPDPETPEEPDPSTPDPASSEIAAQFDFSNETPAYTTTPEFTAWSTSTAGEGDLGNITAIEKDGVKVEFPEGPTTHARLWKASRSYDLRLYKTQAIKVSASDKPIAGVLFYAMYNNAVNITESASGTALVTNAVASTRQRAVLPAKFVASWTAAAGAEPKEVNFEVTATTKLAGLEVLTLLETGVEAVNLATGKVSGVYDLQGRKLAKPSKGLFILNGKKVLF